MPFGLKNVGATFQHAMSYIFHDLSHIILAYLDGLTVQSNHLKDLCIVFEQCHQYNIHLNLLKCVFCITIGHILGFLVSQHGIQVDPFQVQSISVLPPR